MIREMPKIDTLFFEKRANKQGFKTVAGIDEAGRGPLAGPVVAAAVVVKDFDFENRIDDSKKLSAKRREQAFLEIMDKCDIGIGESGVEEIDEINIYQATLLAMKRAVLELSCDPDHLLVDGRMKVPLDKKMTLLEKGESKSVSIAAASIIAKVYRDKLMLDLDEKYPWYGFSSHKGYGTARHIEAIRERGLSPVHRKTFGPFGKK